MRLSGIYGIDVVQQVPEGVDEALGEDPGAEDLAGGQVDEDGHQRQVDLQLLRLDGGRMFTTRDRVQDRQNLLCNGKNRSINLARTSEAGRSSAASLGQWTDVYGQRPCPR